jgi:hypothetical protein
MSKVRDVQEGEKAPKQLGGFYKLEIQNRVPFRGTLF